MEEEEECHGTFNNESNFKRHLNVTPVKKSLRCNYKHKKQGSKKGKSKNEKS